MLRALVGLSILVLSQAATGRVTCHQLGVTTICSGPALTPAQPQSNAGQELGQELGDAIDAAIQARRVRKAQEAQAKREQELHAEQMELLRLQQQQVRASLAAPAPANALSDSTPTPAFSGYFPSAAPTDIRKDVSISPATSSPSDATHSSAAEIERLRAELSAARAELDKVHAPASPQPNAKPIGRFVRVVNKHLSSGTLVCKYEFEGVEFQRSFTARCPLETSVPPRLMKASR